MLQHVSEKLTDSIFVSQTVSATTPEPHMGGFDTQTIPNDHTRCEIQPQTVEGDWITYCKSSFL